jgi:plastocyanin
MKQLSYLVAFSVIALASLVPTVGAQEDEDQEQPQDQQGAGTQQTPADWSVSIEDAFDPADAAIASGDAITFTNEDDEPHTVTADDGQFDSGMLNPGDSVTVRFEGAGTLTYYCTLHPRMVGSVTVS